MTDSDLSIETFKMKLARDAYLQLAGMEAIAGLGGNYNLYNIARRVLADRDSGVLNRLGNALDLAELSTLGDAVTWDMVESRLPHVAVLLTYETARALAEIWPQFERARVTVNNAR